MNRSTLLTHQLARAGGEARRRGRRGERIAARWLRHRGHRVLARNLRIGRFELDLLVESPDGRHVIIVEVKTGRGEPAQLAARAGARQLRRLEQMAAAIGQGPLVRGRSMRLDIVLVMLDRPRARRVVHLRGSGVC